MYKKIVILFFFISSVFGINTKEKSIEIICNKPTPVKKKQLKNHLNNAPILTATGNQIYCPLSQMKIVTDFNIVDDDTGIDAIYIQLSSGYVGSQDLLTLTGNHPNVNATWHQPTGKLTLTGVSGQATYPEIIAAVKDVVYRNYSVNLQAGTKTFSITVGQANYLPSNGHYYEFIPNIGITWSDAKIAAENSTYYGLQGYLATITAADEAQLAGEQVLGAGWIGGSDEENEGIWKWMTGPEAGLIFWNGEENGSSPNYSNWNNNEPNNIGNEDYAHINALGAGIRGSWNDLSNIGEANGNYHPKGYIVEYGGSPGDPTLSISTSSTIIIPGINPVSSYVICNNLPVTMNATATAGVIKWYENQTGGIPIGNGESFTTPILTTPTTYYIDAFPIGCTTGTRTPISVNVNQTPTVTAPSETSICENETTTLTANASTGTIQWHVNPTSTTPIFIGETFTTPSLSQPTIYYIEAINNNCSSLPRISVLVNVNPKPLAIQDSEKIICEGTNTILSAEISEMNYYWSTGETTQNITATNEGLYSVEIINSFNCSTTQNFELFVIEKPIINSVNIDGNKAIIITNTGNFEYSIDGIYFQSSNIFQLSESGIYNVSVRDKNSCGENNFIFTYINYPAFFSPNNDGYNDYWHIKGMNFYNNPEVTIFDRYGKIIGFIDSQNPIWDGTYNGKQLPADDYWFVAKISDTLPEHKGHFSLIR